MSEISPEAALEIKTKLFPAIYEGVCLFLTGSPHQLPSYHQSADTGGLVSLMLSLIGLRYGAIGAAESYEHAVEQICTEFGHQAEDARTWLSRTR
jgi:hypothetical protein